MNPTIRPLESHRDYEACVALQRETWGSRSSEIVPPAVLMIARKTGGVASGAFDSGGAMLGCVFGLTGWQNGRLVHWSHFLAVGASCRDQGVGSSLKQHQRAELLALGVHRMMWTYDPLVARNAHVNIVKLGAQVMEYVLDRYPGDPGNLADSVIGSDRFVVEWALADDRPPAPEDWSSAPPALIAGEGADATRRFPDAPMVRVEIPADIQSLKSALPDVARAWRATTREIFQHYLQQGYRITSFVRDPEWERCFYLLTPSSNPETA
jgi:predicted GNAT superfamily acetyltransferase